jgi:hypothetical protein
LIIALSNDLMQTARLGGPFCFAQLPRHPRRVVAGHSRTKDDYARA